MNTAQQIINEILSTGTKFTLNDGEIGLTQMVDDDLLQRARRHKAEIKTILLSARREANTQKPKVWKLKIRTGQGIDSMSMIDPARMTENECRDCLIKQFGENRIVSFEVKP